MALKPHAMFWKLITVSSIFANEYKQGPDVLFYREPAVIYGHVRLLYLAFLNLCFQPAQLPKN